jgi:hypothetical protein
VFHDDYEWWAARDIEHARELQRRDTGLTSAEQAPGDDWREVPLDKQTRWYQEDGTFREMTFGQIVREAGGPGLLGGTDW